MDQARLGNPAEDFCEAGIGNVRQQRRQFFVEVAAVVDDARELHQRDRDWRCRGGQQQVVDLAQQGLLLLAGIHRQRVDQTTRQLRHFDQTFDALG